MSTTNTCVWFERLLLGLILAGALVMRLSGLDVFLTTDENFWAERSRNFGQAVARHEWAGTYQSVHPGVVTMWVGTLGTSLAAAAEHAGIAQAVGQGHPATQAGVSSQFPEITLDARRLVAFLTWAGIVAVYLLLRRVFGRRAALLAAALLALDPAYLALSRVHHLDALLATFMLVSAAGLLVHVDRGQRRYLVVSALAAGLAIANKSPGLFMVGWAGLTLMAAAWARGSGTRRARLLRAAGDGLVWGSVAGGVVLALWPALWVDPAGTAGKVLAGAIGYSQTPHEYMNFFLSEATPDPGPLFYPASWLFRTTPAVVAGLIGLVVAVRRRDLRGPVAALLVLACGYVVFMMLGSKKLEKYILPSYLALDVLAAVGWLSLLDRVAPALRQGWRAWAAPLLAAGVTASQLALVAPAYPYYFSYYDPLLGGPHTAPQALRVGYGECLDRAAQYLNAKPNPGSLHVATTNVAEFSAFFAGRTSDAGAVPAAEPDYYALYLPHIQRWLLPKIMEHFRDAQIPEAVVNCSGIDYVWIYRNTFFQAEVGQALDYVALHAESAGEGIVLDVDAAWRRTHSRTRPVTAIAGPGRADFVLTGLERASAGARRLWLMTFPDPPGDTRKLITRYLKEQGERIDEVKFGDVRLACYKLRDGARFLPPGPNVSAEVRLGDRVELLGYDLPRGGPSPGKPFTVRLYWQAQAPVETSYTVFSHLVGPGGRMAGQLDGVPQGGARPTSTWQPGETIVDDYMIDVAADAPPGEYALAVGMYDAATMRRLPAIDATGRRLADDQVVVDGLQFEP